jgi:DHA2 family multidrug resistance protein-like MFS transporter
MRHFDFADHHRGQQVTRRRSDDSNAVGDSDDIAPRMDIESMTFHPEPSGQARATAEDSLDGLPLPQRYWAMLTIAVAVSMTVLDAVVANVALPTIARDVGASPAASIWVVNAYQLALVISLLPLSSLGDIVGYRKVYQSGFAVFTIASLCCALSHSLISLGIARFIQGLGAAGIVSVNTALIRTIFPSKILGRGLGINAMVVAVSAAIGPTFAAGILSLASWPWLFAVNVPVGILGLGISLRTLPRSGGSGHRFDLKSALLSGLTFGLLISGVDGFGHGQAAWAAAAEIIAAILIGIMFVRRQLSQPVPLFAVDLLRRPIFALSVATSVCSFAAQMLAYVSLPFYLQNVLGRTPVECGLLISPWPLAILLAAPIAGHLADRYSAGILGGAGLATMTLGLISLALLPAHPDSTSIIWRMALCGLGFGFFQAPNNREMLASAPKQRSGAASGMLGTARVTGQTLGAALVALIFTMFSNSGNTVALVVGAGFAAGAAIVSCMRIGRPPAGYASHATQ